MTICKHVCHTITIKIGSCTEIALQCCVGFCHTTMWINHNYTYIPSLLSLPTTLLHPTFVLCTPAEGGEGSSRVGGWGLSPKFILGLLNFVRQRESEGEVWWPSQGPCRGFLWFCVSSRYPLPPTPEVWMLMAARGGWAAPRHGFNGLGTGQNPVVPLVTFGAPSSWDCAKTLKGVLVSISHLHASLGLCRVLQTFSSFCPLRMSCLMRKAAPGRLRMWTGS